MSRQNFYDYEFLKESLASPFIQDNEEIQLILRVCASESILFKEKVYQLSRLLDSDYPILKEEEHLLSMMAEHIDPMHVFDLLSERTDKFRKKQLLSNLINIFRKRGSIEIQNFLLEVYLKYYNIYIIQDYDDGTLLLELTYDIDRYIEEFYELGYHPDINKIVTTIKVLYRELLIGGHLLSVIFKGLLVEIENCYPPFDDLSGVLTVNTVDDEEPDVSDAEFMGIGFIMEEVPPIASNASYQILPAPDEVLNKDFILNGSKLNEFEGDPTLQIVNDGKEIDMIMIIDETVPPLVITDLSTPNDQQEMEMVEEIPEEVMSAVIKVETNEDSHLADVEEGVTVMVVVDSKSRINVDRLNLLRTNGYTIVYRS